MQSLLKDQDEKSTIITSQVIRNLIFNEKTCTRCFRERLLLRGPLCLVVLFSHPSRDLTKLFRSITMSGFSLTEQVLV